MAAAATGSRVLGEIEETTLEEVLESLRLSFNNLGNDDPAAAAAITAEERAADNHGNAKRKQQRPLKRFPIPALNSLAAKHLRATGTAVVSVSGRSLPLVYLLVATLIAPPYGKAVVVVDLEARFDITRVLECTPYAATAGDDANTTRPPALEITAGLPPMTAEAALGQGNPKLQLKLQQQQDQWVITEGSAAATAGPNAAAAAPVTPPPAVGGQSRGARSRVSLSDLAHVYVHRPTRRSGTPAALVGDAVAAAEQHMLYGTHGSGGREWWGTFVIGGNGKSINSSIVSSVAVAPPPPPHGAGPSLPSSAASPSPGVLVDVAAGPRGWLRVEREDMGGFEFGSSAEEALRDRERRRRAVDAAGWTATSVWGGFNFREN